jgi:membrane protease YdiL (CAAX protease family)
MNQRLKEWIKRHPIEAFFLLGTAICFGTLFPAVLIIPKEDTLGKILSFYLGKIGVYSPVLAGMFVTRIINPVRQKTSFTRRLFVFLPVWIIAEIIHVAGIWLSVPPDTSLVLLIVLSVPVAVLPAFVFSSACAGSDDVKRMLATLVRPTGKLVYYLVALLAFPVIHIVGVGITNILKGKVALPQVSNGVDLAFTVLVTFFSVLLFSGGINEESGWRGFAQRRMQARYSPLLASLILWVLMVVWHIPNDIDQYQYGGYLLVRIALYPFITVLFAWVYNRTNGSILAPAVFHASMNAMNPLMGIFPITTAGNILLVGFAIIAVIADRMWRKLPGDHPAVYQGASASTSDTLSDHHPTGAGSARDAKRN